MSTFKCLLDVLEEENLWARRERLGNASVVLRRSVSDVGVLRSASRGPPARSIGASTDNIALHKTRPWI